MDRVGAVETEKKTEEQDSSLKPVESIKTSKVARDNSVLLTLGEPLNYTTTLSE